MTPVADWCSCIKKTPDEILVAIDAAENAKDVGKIVNYICITSSVETGGDSDWAEAAETSLDALYRLVKAGNSKPNQSLKQLKCVFDALTAWQEEETIVEVGLGCIVAISSNAKKSNDDSDIAVDVEFILELMKDFVDRSAIQEQACLAIEGLAQWRLSWKDALATAEGMKEELQEAHNFRIMNERNKSYPVRAAKTLGIEGVGGITWMKLDRDDVEIDVRTDGTVRVNDYDFDNAIADIVVEEIVANEKNISQSTCDETNDDESSVEIAI